MMELWLLSFKLVVITALIVSATSSGILQNVQASEVKQEEQQEPTCDANTYMKYRYCIQGWERNKVAPICLKTFYEKVNYWKATKMCRNIFSELVVIENEALDKTIKLAAKHSEAFIGLNYNETKGYWNWRNGHKLNYSNWNVKIDNAVVMDNLLWCATKFRDNIGSSGIKWKKRTCREKFDFICERSVEKSSYSVSMKMPSKDVGGRYLNATCNVKGDFEKGATFQVFFYLKDGSKRTYSKDSRVNTMFITTHDSYRYQEKMWSKVCVRDSTYVLRWPLDLEQTHLYRSVTIECCSRKQDNQTESVCDSTTVDLSSKRPNVTELERKKEDDHVYTYLSCDAFVGLERILTWGVTAGVFEEILAVDVSGNVKRSGQSKDIVDHINVKVAEDTATTGVGRGDHFISKLRVNSDKLFEWGEEITIRCCACNLLATTRTSNIDVDKLPICTVHTLRGRSPQPPILKHTAMFNNRQLLGHLTCSTYVGSERILSWSVSAGSFNVLLFVGKYGKVTSSQLQAYVNQVAFSDKWDAMNGHQFTSNVTVKLQHLFKLSKAINVTCYSYDVTKSAPIVSIHSGNSSNESLSRSHIYHHETYSDNIARQSELNETKPDNLFILFLWLSIPFAISCMVYCCQPYKKEKKRNKKNSDSDVESCNPALGYCPLPRKKSLPVCNPEDEVYLRKVAVAPFTDVLFTEENIEAIGSLSLENFSHAVGNV